MFELLLAIFFLNFFFNTLTLLLVMLIATGFAGGDADDRPY